MVGNRVWEKYGGPLDEVEEKKKKQKQMTISSHQSRPLLTPILNVLVHIDGLCRSAFPADMVTFLVEEKTHRGWTNIVIGQQQLHAYS